MMIIQDLTQRALCLMLVWSDELKTMKLVLFIEVVLNAAPCIKSSGQQYFFPSHADYIESLKVILVVVFCQL